MRRAVENAPDYADLVAAGHCASPFTISVHVPREGRATKTEILASPGYTENLTAQRVGADRSEATTGGGEFFAGYPPAETDRRASASSRRGSERSATATARSISSTS